MITPDPSGKGSEILEVSGKSRQESRSILHIRRKESPKLKTGGVNCTQGEGTFWGSNLEQCIYYYC